MRYLKIYMLVGLLLINGCSSSETYFTATLVINGTTEFPGAAYVVGPKGFEVKLDPLVQTLGGTIQVYDERGVLIVLNGKRILYGYVAEINYDHRIAAPTRWEEGAPWIGDSELIELIKTAYPKGDAYRQEKKVYIVTNE
jgi:hypothetical protein